MTFQEYILHQLREMKREVLTAIENVSAEDMLSFEPAGHWPIAWIVEHCTQVADGFLIAPVAGKPMHKYEVQVADWPNREPKPGDGYPSTAEIAHRWETLCDRIIDSVGGMSEAALQSSPGREPYIQSILRIINHTNSHLRSLWCILGERRVDHKWAEQQSFLA